MCAQDVEMILDKVGDMELKPRNQRGGGIHLPLILHMPPGFIPLALYRDCNQDILLSQKNNLDVLAIWNSHSGYSIMLPFKLESNQGAVLYNPQRVLRQLGYDQGAVTISTDNESHLVTDAEVQLLGDDNDKIFEVHHKLLWPFVGRVGLRSL